ncbi:MAG: LysM peptidoglycan-binding domain-containing protein [Anaerovoracaceae bacterium]
MNTKKYRLANRKRFGIFISTVMLVLSIGIFAGLSFTNSAAADTVPKSISVEVNTGDTIWDYAAEYLPDNIDLRDGVFMIKEANNLSTVELTPGQTIKIPEL